MKVTLSRPTAALLDRFLERARSEPFSYPEVGATALGKTVPGYDNDQGGDQIGEGREVFDAAKDALREWSQFPDDWTFIYPIAPLEENQTVAMCARAFGLWWISAAKIVYTVDEPNRFGFAYGTLLSHVECGEEQFFVEIDDDEQVFYRLRAFSKPRRWFIRLGYPLSLRLQRRRESQGALEKRMDRILA